MMTAKVKCSAPHSSHNALCIIDTKGTEAYIPFQFVINKKYHQVTNEVCEVTIPLWLAIDRGVKYQENKGYKKLYTAANMLMAKVGCDGEIELNTNDKLTGNIMDALFEIDGGAFCNEKYGEEEEHE